MGIIITIIVGFIVGLLARFIMPGNDKMGFILTTVLGIAGSALANFAGIQLGFYQQGDAAGWIMSVVGALVVLFVYNKFFRKA